MLYEFTGNWPSQRRDHETGSVGLFDAQDSLKKYDRLEPDSAGLVDFVEENQGVRSLTTELTDSFDAPLYAKGDYGLVVEDIEEWKSVNPSLASFLITFCFQELTFGSRTGVWDADLTDS